MNVNTGSVNNNTGNQTSLRSVSHFTREHMKDVPHANEGGQEIFKAIRAENPLPLSKGAQELMKVRGLTDDPNINNASSGKGINVYA